MTIQDSLSILKQALDASFTAGVLNFDNGEKTIVAYRTIENTIKSNERTLADLQQSNKVKSLEPKKPK